ncbi:MAG: MarR family transcriptional regulator [Actinomycetota bacterium]
MTAPQLRAQASIGIGILSQLFQNRLARLLAPVGLNYNQLALLTHLSRAAEPASISELAEALEINQPGITKMVRRLEDARMVAIAGVEGDRRRRVVTITDGGRVALEGAMVAIDADNVGWFDGWTDEETADFADKVFRLVGWLDANRLA